jgi:crotonobetainyl-CoA:carnitine CoA-transferase CaiB-like acyl-CoA transferase
MSAPGPLHGLRVLDFTQFLSGPFGTMVLGDLGADVVKVEPPAGELSRTIPPHFVGEDSVYYLSVNRNKRSVVADLKNPADLERIRALALTADVVVENFKPGVLERLGLRYEDIAASRPGLVWCSISGFGQNGPWRDWPAYDMMVQALSGGMSLTGEPGRQPVRSGIPLADLSAGLFGVIGILSALHEARATGKGRWVDVAMLDCQLSMLSYQAAYHLHSGVVPGPQGRAHDSIPTYRAFTAGDGASVVVTANTEAMWRELARALGCADLLADPRYESNAQRFLHREALWEVLDAAFLARPAREWVERLLAANVPAGLVNTLDAALSSEHASERGMVVQLADDDPARRIRVAGNPIRFQDEPSAPARFPPWLGQHTAEVTGDWLG